MAYQEQVTQQSEDTFQVFTFSYGHGTHCPQYKLHPFFKKLQNYRTNLLSLEIWNQSRKDNC